MIYFRNDHCACQMSLAIRTDGVSFQIISACFALTAILGQSRRESFLCSNISKYMTSILKEMKPMHHVYFLTDRLHMGKALNC